MAARMLALLSMTLLVVSVGCSGGDDAQEAASEPNTQQLHQASANSKTGARSTDIVPGGSFGEEPPQVQIADVIVEIDTTAGKIRLRLFAGKAPNTVANFVTNYVENHAYDDTIVHFSDPEFMIALGGFNANYEPIPTQEAILSEADNGLQNKAGTVAMARMPDYVHSATSQFFINVVDNPSLDYQEREDDAINGYCVFGKVIEGMDVVRKIAQSPTGDRTDFPSTPTPPVIVKSAQVVGSPAGAATSKQ